MNHRRLLISTLSAVVLLMGTTLVVSAQRFQFLQNVKLPQAAQPTQAPKATPSDNQVNAVAHQLYCPVCENISLDVCPTQACADWRELIRQKLALGWKDQQIKDYFALQYGDRVLAEPPTRGLNLLVYILPPLAFLGGALIVFGVLRQMRKPRLDAAAAQHGPDAGMTPPAAGDDPYLRQVEEELKRHEKE